ncbi:MAG: DUF3617 domain-containing protein [Sphingobium sp.]|nr:MAG: DUF3617 domain-containing protein [Sphingobium sp.]
MPRTVSAAVPLAMIFALAACKEEPAPAPVEEAPILLTAGEWQLDRTQTAYNTPTVTAQEYAAHVGKKSSETICLAVDKDGKPDADALAGTEGSDCTYKDVVVRKGRFIATLACKAGEGTSEISVEGNYKPDSLTFGIAMTKSVNGSPVLSTTHDLWGKRLGECKATEATK